MNYKKIFVHLIASVWLINGLLCKVLGLVPRHQEIVETINNFDKASAYFLTKLIGFSEIIMAIWIITRIQSRFNAVLQIAIIVTMNSFEFVLASDLLLWGKWNFVFVLLFCIFIYYNEFILNKKSA